MPSKLITPPNVLDDQDSILIVNAYDRDIELLVLWLQHVRANLNIYLYHSLMPEYEWSIDRIVNSSRVLVNNQYSENLTQQQLLSLESRTNVYYYGNKCQYQDLLSYFTENLDSFDKEVDYLYK